jgi:TonB family protein
MSDHRPAEKPFAIGERRLHTRTPVTPQAFVKFGPHNYGFVFNISESGLVFAPTGTLTLAVGAVAKMRFQLPDSKEWIETNGEVAWIGESQREAGVRFVDLMDDTRAKIRDWISQEPVRPDLPDARDAIRNALAGSQPSTSGVIPEEDKVLKSIFADPGLFLVGSKSARSKPAVQPGPIVADEPPQAPSAAPVTERRSHPRRRVLSLEYLDLGDSNGGIVLNLGEDGMYIQAVASLSPDHISNLSFKIPDSDYEVETSGNIVWVGESRKDAGIQFDNLPEEARLKIREWVALEFPSRRDSSQRRQPAGAGKLVVEPAQLVEMPPKVAVKSPPVLSDSPAIRTSDQKPDFISELPASEVAPSSLQNSANVSVDLAARKQADSDGKPPVINVASPLVQKPADIPANNVPSKQTDLPGKSSSEMANAAPTVVPKPVDARSPAFQIPKPPIVAAPNADVARPGADEKKPVAPAASISAAQIQNRPAKPGAPNVTARKDDRRNAARETSAASSDLNWSIAEPPVVNAAPNRRAPRKDVALVAGVPRTITAEIATQTTLRTRSFESPETTSYLNLKSLAAAILVVVLLSFAAGWIAAGPSGRKQFLDRFVSQQSDSSQSTENPGSTSAQTDAPAPGAGSSQTNTTTAPEQTVNPAATQPALQAPPNIVTQPDSQANASSPQPASQIPYATSTSPAPASKTSRPTVASTENAATIAREKSATAKRDSVTSPSTAPKTTNSPNAPSVAANNTVAKPTPPPNNPTPTTPISTVSSSAPGATNSSLSNAPTSSNKPGLAANNVAPPNASRESRTSQPNSASSSPASSVSSASNTAQPKPAQPTLPVASAPSNPPTSVAKSVPSPAPASASSTPTAAAEVVKAIVSVNASPFPSIRVPPELKSQISKQGASLQIGQLISRVEPTYPEDAQHQRIEGVVKLRAIIARDGSIQDIDQTSGPPLLVAAAANAVRQWRYKPTSLDGQSVEATEAITITFRLQSTRAN